MLLLGIDIKNLREQEQRQGREGGKERKTGWRGLRTHACDALLDE